MERIIQGDEGRWKKYRILLTFTLQGLCFLDYSSYSESLKTKVRGGMCADLSELMFGLLRMFSRK